MIAGYGGMIWNAGDAVDIPDFEPALFVIQARFWYDAAMPF